MLNEPLLVEALDARMSLYRFFSALLFQEASETDLEKIEKIDLPLHTESGSLLHEGASMMHRYLKRRTAATRQELAVDFTRCFLGACMHQGKDRSYRGDMAMPYESLYTSDTGLLMQEARDEVFLAYKCEALRLKEGTDVPDDHLSFEFEFMAMETQRAMEALAGGDIDEAMRCLSIQQVFHRDHVLNWIDPFCDDMGRVAQTDFYRGLASAIRGFAHDDASFLEDALCVFSQEPAA